MIAPLLILVVFLIFAALMYTRKVPALLAVPAMAVIMALVAGVPLAGVGTIVVTGASALAPAYVTVIFGALLARVTLDTGIARSIINFAAEFGGEQPLAVALSMSAVVALLFVTFNGLGAIIMVGSVVLPIMMTTGVPRKIAATMFLMAFGLGFIFNPAIWKLYTQLFGVSREQMYSYAVVLAAIDVIALLVYAFVSFRNARGYATWAVRTKSETRTPPVPAYALITPILPIVLTYVPSLHFDPIIAFVISAVYGAITARPLKAIQTLTAAAIRGLEDVAPAVILFIGIGMLATAAKQPEFAAALHVLSSSQGLHNPWIYVIVFGVLSPLALYRGPLNPFGIGAAVFVLLAGHALPPILIVAAVMAVVQVQNVCDPTNTANVWIANFTGVQVVDITKRTLPYQVAVAIVACIVVVTSSPHLFGVHPFTAAIPAASAQELYPTGMFVGPSAASRIAVGSDGSADAQTAVPAVVEALRNAPGTQVSAQRDDPNGSDCSNKRYAAYVNVTSTRFMLIEGIDVDIGVQLFDCGGWEVTEWHDHAVFAQASATDAAQLARQGVDRLLGWAQSNPQRWSNLQQRGLAFAPGDPPSYYYALYKTVDGNMRAYVRAGGPAYAAGMRTDDIVDKLDGLDWWMYGTYQTQARAYDGKPHSFQLERAGSTIAVQLGAPFAS
jgi:H+/gluconate symporter-like permease